MQNFKQRWEISKNWQLIHPFLALLGASISGYLIGRAIANSWGTPYTLEYTLILCVSGILASAAIVLLSLWLFKKLYKRWGVTERWQLIAMFLVFAVTGSSAGRLSDPLMDLVGLNKEQISGWLYWPVRILLIFPIYQILLVIFGWIFGQYTFFKHFATKMASRMGLGFIFKRLP